jgi:hypothetical protein
MLIESIFQILKNDPGVLAVIGNPRKDGSAGIYPLVAPSATVMPYVVWQQVGAAHVISYDGVNRLQKATFQFACYAASFLTSHKLAAAVKNALNGILGDFTNGAVPPVFTRIEGAWLQTERDLIEEVPHGTIFADVVDYQFWFVDSE